MISKIIAEELIGRFREAIHVKNEIVIVSHVSPDGDAIGSSLALWHYLRQLGKNAYVIVPNAFPAFLSWMPGAKNIVYYDRQKTKSENLLTQAELIIALDFNAAKRLDKMEKAFLDASAPKILIDHHLHPEDFAQIVVSYPEISSTSEMIFRLICRLGHFDKITRECAECILTGLMTDTGGFSFNSNQAEIYIIVAELIKLGVDKDEIYRRVFNTFSLDRLKLSAFSIYRKMTVFPEYKTAVILLTVKELERFNYKIGDIEGIVNMPLSIDGIIFSVLMREDTDKIKISLRSQGAFPANKVAADLFDGGGHLNAAGGEFTESLQTAFKKLKNALPDYVEFLEEKNKN
jgi:phosphoesterase RecJ-like protein